MNHNTLPRRDFVTTAGASLSAAAYAQTRGSNDRLRIAIVGPGGRGTSLMRDFFQFAHEMNAEMVAVCDLWSKRRDEAAARVQEMMWAAVGAGVAAGNRAAAKGEGTGLLGGCGSPLDPATGENAKN